MIAQAAPSSTSSRPDGVVGRLRTLPPHWPITACFALFPLWWALGLGALIWPLFALPLGARMLIKRRSFAVPAGFGLWVIFLGVTFISGSLLQDSEALISWAWRLLNLISSTIFFLAICSADENEIPSRHVIKLLSNFWIVVMLGGWLGVLLPNGSLPSLVEALLPPSLVDHEFVRTLVEPSFAQVQNVLGYPLGRPKAPFVYTNDWGSAYALLLPFFFLMWFQVADIAKRSWATLMLLASLVPVFISLNRGMWVSLAIALGYASTRRGEFGQMARRALLIVGTLGLLLIVFTPVRGVVEGRAEHDHSSAGRSILYVESIKIATHNPILGVGGPQEYTGNKIIPRVGTQGMIWNVMVSTGLVGLGLFGLTWIRWIWQTRAGPPITFWCHVVLLVGLVQTLVYDMIPASLHIVFVAAALGHRALNGSRATARLK